MFGLGPLWWQVVQQVVQVVTAPVLLAACGVAGLVLVWHRQRAERARQARIQAVLSGWLSERRTVADLQQRIAQETHAEPRYGRHAFRTQHPDDSSPVTDRVPVQGGHVDDDTRPVPVVSRSPAPLAGPTYGGRG
jgi:hypothetical protein